MQNSRHVRFTRVERDENAPVEVPAREVSLMLPNLEMILNRFCDYFGLHFRI